MNLQTVLQACCFLHSVFNFTYPISMAFAFAPWFGTVLLFFVPKAGYVRSLVSSDGEVKFLWASLEVSKAFCYLGHYFALKGHIVSLYISLGETKTH